jgi:hypothetical protein
MCVRVICENHDITTVRELRAIAPAIVCDGNSSDIVEDACLCQVNVAATLENAGLKFIKDDLCDYVLEPIG